MEDMPNMFLYQVIYLIKINDSIEMDVAATLSCSALTAYNAVRNAKLFYKILKSHKRTNLKHLIPCACK